MTATQLRALLMTFPWAEWSDRLKALYAPLYLELLTAGGEAGAEVVAGTFVVDPIVEAFAQHYIGERIVSLQDVTKREVAALIERAITEAATTGTGETVFELGTRIRDLLSAQFDRDARWRADRIARTETAIAYNQGNLQAFRQRGYTHVRVSDGGEGGCDECDALDGQTWTIQRALDEPVEHPNCLPGDMLVSAHHGLQTTFARSFRGEVIVLRTPPDHFLACTTNHPVLTDRGWVAARELRHGDHVISGAMPERIVHVVPDNDQVPAPIEQVARSSMVPRGMPTLVVPASPKDFHGDGAGSEVYVECAFGLRIDNWQPHLLQPLSELALTIVDVQLQAFASLCASLQLLPRASRAADRSVSRLRSALASVRSGASRPQRIGLANRALDAKVTRPSAHLCLAAPAPRRYFCRRLPGPEPLAEHGIARPLPKASALAHRASDRSQRRVHRLDVDADGGRQLWSRLASLVSPTQLTGIDRQDFTGHVFNLQTANGWYVANGIVTHNCRRAFSPATEEDVAAIGTAA